MPRNTTLVRLPEPRILEALTVEVERVRYDEEFMDRLRGLVEEDRAILDRLAERDAREGGSA